MWSRISFRLLAVVCFISLSTSHIIPIVPFVNPLVRNAIIGRNIVGRNILGRQILGRQILGRQILGRQVLGQQLLGRNLLGAAALQQGQMLAVNHALGAKAALAGASAATGVAAAVGANAATNAAAAVGAATAGGLAGGLGGLAGNVGLAGGLGGLTGNPDVVGNGYAVNNVATVPAGVTITNTNPTQDLGVYTGGAGGSVVASGGNFGGNFGGSGGNFGSGSITGTDAGDVVDLTGQNKIGEVLSTVNGLVALNVNAQMILGEIVDRGVEGLFVENNGQIIGQVILDNNNGYNNQNNNGYNNQINNGYNNYNNNALDFTQV